MEKWSGWGLQYFLAYLMLVVDLVPSLEWLCLLGFDQYLTLHLLY